MTAPVNPATATSSTVVANAIKYALAQVGKPYIWGGTGPKGYDCSGLLYMAYLSAGLNITRTTLTQHTQGVPLPPDMPIAQRPAGCLIFPDSGHVYMALGNGQVVEAPHTGVNIRVTNDYSPRAWAIRQVAPANGTTVPGVFTPAGLESGAAGVASALGFDPAHLIDVIGNWLFYITLTLIGGALMAAGLIMLFRGTAPAKALRKAIPL